MASPDLLGRAAERAVLEGLAADLRRGQGRALLVRGEAGVGKTALLGCLLESVSDMAVARAVGVESEMELAFASLHQLCVPMLDRLPRIPPPQRQALGIVFGLDAGPPPDRFVVALAVLSLFSEVAEERPLLCVVDDAQWLDHASAVTLVFVARRLLAEPVGIVFAAREVTAELRAVPELEVRGLGYQDARALLDSAVRSRLDERVRDRIIAETRGNPLALLELPRGLTAKELAGGFGIHGPQDVSGQIQQSFVRRLAALAEDAQRLVLLAAAEPTGDPLLLWRAAERHAIGPAAADEAQSRGLLTIDAQVRFRHPLARSAVYGSAAAEERRAAHLALAQATDPILDPDRHAWHLAAAADRPDEEVARQLELSAGRAQARGGLAAAAAFLNRAVALTAEAAPRAERALAAAQANLRAGAFDATRGYLAAAEAGPLDALGQAQLDLVRARTASVQSVAPDAAALLLRAARKLEPLDARLARDTYLEAWCSALIAGQLANPGSTLLDVSRAAVAAPAPPGGPLPSDVLLDGLALLFTEGRPAAVPVLRRAVAAFSGTDVPGEQLLKWGWLASRAGNLVWDYDASLDISKRAVRAAREFGALEVLGLVDNACGQATALSGDLATAAVYAAELDAVKEATGSRVMSLAAVALAGIGGREPGAFQLIKAVIDEATAGGQGAAVQYGQWASAVLLNGQGRYEEALAAAVAATEATPELFLAMWSLAEMIEAATRTGRAELAQDALARLRGQTRDTDTDWALGIFARSSALVSEGEVADRRFQEAIDHLAHTRLRPDLARAHLLYGEWLRRGRRRAEARAQLRAAHGHFASMGMEAFAERARQELLATGEKARRRAAETRDELTPQERQIAGLARDGLSNPEIGARLFLSPRTVEWHLRKVFTKLGVQSRWELQAALADGGDGLPGVP